MKEQIKEVLKEMFKNGDINIYVESEGDSYHKSVTTTIEVWMDGERLAREKDTAYLGD